MSLSNWRNEVSDIADIETGATVGEVFRDVHGQAQAMVDRLDAMRIERGIDPRLNKWVPGFRLFVDSYTGRSHNGGQPISRIIGAAEPNQFGLVSVTNVHRFDPTEGVIPTRVEAYRGHEDGRDYSLTEKGYRGKIVTRLGKAGVVDELPHEPFGVHSSHPDLRVSDLSDTELERLHIVRHGILNNLNGVELVLNGAPVSEVFEGRPLPQGGFVAVAA